MIDSDCLAVNLVLYGSLDADLYLRTDVQCENDCVGGRAAIDGDGDGGVSFVLVTGGKAMDGWWWCCSRGEQQWIGTPSRLSECNTRQWMFWKPAKKMHNNTADVVQAIYA